MTDAGLDRVASVSGVLRWLVLAAIVFLVGLAAALILRPSLMAGAAESVLPGAAAGPGGVQHLLLVPLVLAGLGVPVAALWHLFRLFGCFHDRRILDREPARHLRMFGVLLILLALVRFLLPTLAVLVLTWANPPGERMLMIRLPGAVVEVAFFGALALVLGWAHGAAAEMADENRQFV